MIERIEDFINAELRTLADEYYEEVVDIMYDEMVEEMYGSDPRWAGSDWDEF